MIIVNDYIDDIFNDFKEYLDNQKKLCELKEEVYFYSNHIPNYDKLCVQQLYLLRYAYAYIYEYMEMYSYMFNYFYQNKVNYNGWRILSVGVGAGLDLYSLDLCNNFIYNNINYTGVDVIDWNYRPKNIPKVSFCFSNLDLEYFVNDDNNEIYSKIIFFPKSIGEITEDTLKLLPTKIKSDEIYLMISFAFDKDRSKLKTLLESFEDNGFIYTILYNREKTDRENKVELHNKYKIDAYPQDIKNFIYRLNDCCNEVFICSDIADCNNKLSRYPTETDINFNYIIIEIQRM